LVLNGTLFAECEINGANRDGMMRLTEEITQRLVTNPDLDISFANTVLSEKYSLALKTFTDKHYPGHLIFSKKPSRIFDIIKWRPIKKRLKKFLPDPFYPEIDDADVFHSFYHPFPSSVLKNKINRSVTFLDIIPLRFSGYSGELVSRTREIVKGIEQNYAISISEFSRNDLLDYNPAIDPSRVFVAPLAASKELFYKNNDEVDFNKVKEKYGLPNNYFLCVAGNDIRKNVDHIIKCFNRFILQEKHGDIFLVLAGNGSHSRSILAGLNLSQEVAEKIFIPTRFIDTDDLAVLYSNAISFFFMSLYEGFGLPTLEAMQCGVATVTSNTTSLAEVAGDGAITLSPKDEDGLCEIMSRLYSDSELRKKYETAGLARAKEFSWERCAGEYAEIFKMIK